MTTPNFASCLSEAGHLPIVDNLFRGLCARLLRDPAFTGAHSTWTQSRRTFLFSTAFAAVLFPLSGCAYDANEDYQRKQAQLRIRLRANPGLLDLIRLATLAPSGHNTQSWHFTLTETGVRIRPDLSRRTGIVDPDDHHLFVSLGCASENLMIAATAVGKTGNSEFDEMLEGQIDTGFTRGPAKADALYPAILDNQSSRSNYDGRAVSLENLKLLESQAA